MTSEIIFVAVVLFGGGALVVARRWKNNDSQAGYGIAGWLIFLLLMRSCH